jgi:hypothetical protein
VFITCLKRIIIQVDLSNDYQPLDFSNDDKNEFKIDSEDSVLGLEDGILKESRTQPQDQIEVSSKYALN